MEIHKQGGGIHYTVNGQLTLVGKVANKLST